MRHFFEYVWFIFGEWGTTLGGWGCMGHYFGWLGVGALFDNAR